MPRIFLGEISVRDRTWDKHKAEAITIADNYRAGGYDRYADRVYGCSPALDMSIISNEQAEISMKLKYADFCRVRLCPICQWRRCLKWRSRFLKALPKLLEDHPSSRFIFLTLTLKNCDLSDLRDTLSGMQKGYQKMSQLQKFPAIGYLKSVEITRNDETDQAHPHLHCLLMVPAGYFGKGYLTQKKWSNLWKKSMGINYNPIVHIRAVRDDHSTKSDLDDKEIDMKKAIYECLKYAVKVDDLKHSPIWLCELHRQIHLLRFTILGGIFRDYFKDEQEGDSLIHISDDLKISAEHLDALPSMRFDFDAKKSRYIHK